MLRKKDIKQEKIFQAALKLFALYGFKKTTVEDIASEVGMTKSNIYFYFKNKRDLYDQTVERELAIWRDHATEAISGIDDVIKRFAVLAQCSFEYVIHHEDLRSVMIKDQSILSVTPKEDRYINVNLGAMQLVRDILEEGIAEGRFHPVDITVTTNIFFSNYLMFLIKTYVKSEGEPIARMYQEAFKLLLRGLSTDPSEVPL